ncbi:aspartate-semialdehyde dehydrogenase [Brucella abortus str. 2308 A]|nr:aspartate-semialdehyde dehydrogenase [Brucella ceti str. Cudo]EEP61873.1 aspartate-semialdehyde dehydrogenase [Brucella abortus str. 2308 A]
MELPASSPGQRACLRFPKHLRPSLKRPRKRSDSLGLLALSPGLARGRKTRVACGVPNLEAERDRRRKMGFKVAVAGATGNVGREMLNILEERGFPADEVVPLASRRSQGTEVSYGDKTLKVRALDTYDFSDTDICLMSAGGSVSQEWSPKIGRQGCVVIDNSSAWRYDADVPLIVPEVNPDAIAGFTKKNIIANPNCSTAQLVVALKPLHDAAKIKRVVVSTYQSVSGAGKEGMDELFEQSRAVFVADPISTKKFTKRIAFNVIPHIDVFMEDGYTKEEWKMVAETKKMLDPKIKLTATAVRVPVFIGHSEAVNIEFENPITPEEAREILREAPGCQVIDKHENGGYITPYESAGEDATFISRIREDITVENGLAMWVVSDNLRKGAALNAIQIAELLVARGLIKPKALAA